MWKAFMILLLLFMISCRTDNELKEGYELLKSLKVEIPENSKIIVNGKDTLISDYFESDLKLIVYTDSASCSPCYINKLSYWDEIINYADLYKGQLKIYFIFSPALNDIGNTIVALDSARFNHPVVLDAEGNFYKLNPRFPRNKVFHTLLLDKNNKVIMIGSPMASDDLKKMFKETVEKTLLSLKI